MQFAHGVLRFFLWARILRQWHAPRIRRYNIAVDFCEYLGVFMQSLGEFIVMRQAEYPQAKGELSGILAAIRLAAKVLHRDINRAGLVNDILGEAGSENVQGEAQKKLDIFAHEKIKAAFLARDNVAGFASEEEEDFIAFQSEKNRNAKYIVLTDPLDGSSNI